MDDISWQEQKKNDRTSLVEFDIGSTLKKCDHALQFAQEIIKHSDLTPQVVEKLNERISQIRRRRSDPKLYVAVVGEFNSGKSTFINALLRQDLLKSSTLVRTATATHIVYAPQLDFTLLLKDRSQPLSFQHNREELQQLLSRFSSDFLQCSDIREFLHFITTKEVITSQIEKITIHYPASFLKQNIVIIDTPGINAQQQGLTLHGDIIQEVVEQEADLAIIIIPAYAALAHALYDFVQSSLKPFLHRCIPILTRMDLLESDEERQLVIDDTGKRLAEFFGSTQPVHIYDAAAKVILDTLHVSTPLSPVQEYWINRFTTLEQDIRDLLRYQRTLSIAESLLRLMRQLFKDLQLSLQAHQESYTVRERAIQKALPELDALARRERLACQRQVSQAVETTRKRVKEKLGQTKDKTWSRITSGLYDVESDSDFEDFARWRATSIVNGEINDFRSYFDANISRMQREVAEAEENTRKHFKDAYQRLAFVGNIHLSLDRPMPSSISSVDPSRALSGLTTTATNLNQEDTWKMVGGAGFGAVIGTFIVPGLGTLIGGVLGALFGSFFVSADRKREALRDQLRPSINEFFASVQIQLDNALDSYEANTHRMIDRQIDAHVNQHRSVVAAINAQLESEAEKLRSLRQKIEADLVRIRNYEETLQETQQQLASQHLL